MQPCTDTGEAVKLCAPQGLHLKPIARVNICVQLPQMKTPGKAISNWEVMEKIKKTISPNVFTLLKVTKSTIELIRFEAEVENRADLKGVITKLEGKSIKLSGFPEMLRIRATEAKINFPTRHDWDSYFRDAKNMNEMKPGERPDTIHFQNLPCRWFTNIKKDSTLNKPSEHILKKVFETFGDIRVVEIPILDPYLGEINKKNGTIQTFSFGQDLSFEAFVQYQEYDGFAKAMTALKGMKLMHKDEDGKCFVADIKVDFDKSKYLSEENLRKRQLERSKLIKLEKEREERVLREREEEEKRKEEERKRLEEEQKERERKREEKIKKREERIKQREERRKIRLLEKKKLEEERKTAERKSQEERRKLLDNRKTEASRLLVVLFEKIKEDKKKDDVQKKMQELEKERLRQLEEEERKKEAKAKAAKDEEERRRRQLAEDERLLREKLLNNMKRKQEQRQEEEREKLRKKIAGRARLKSVLIHRAKEKQRIGHSPKQPSQIVVKK